MMRIMRSGQRVRVVNHCAGPVWTAWPDDLRVADCGLGRSPSMAIVQRRRLAKRMPTALKIPRMLATLRECAASEGQVQAPSAQKRLSRLSSIPRRSALRAAWMRLMDVMVAPRPAPKMAIQAKQLVREPNAIPNEDTVRRDEPRINDRTREPLTRRAPSEEPSHPRKKRSPAWLSANDHCASRAGRTDPGSAMAIPVAAKPEYRTSLERRGWELLTNCCSLL